MAIGENNLGNPTLVDWYEDAHSDLESERQAVMVQYKLDRVLATQDPDNGDFITTFDLASLPDDASEIFLAGLRIGGVIAKLNMLEDIRSIVVAEHPEESE